MSEWALWAGVVSTASMAAWTGLRELSAWRAGVRGRESTSRTDLRLMTDYVHTLRGALADAGVEVPPWPTDLTRR